MTDEEINQAIHIKVMNEPCWHEFTTERDYAEWDICLNCKVKFEYGCSNPSYTSDLNAVHRAEMKVIENGRRAYTLILQRTVIEGTEWDWSISYDLAVTATARQRAEAVLRATGNWEEK